MNDNTRQDDHTPTPLSIDILAYLNLLINARWWIVAAAVASALVAGAWAYSKPYMYLSSVQVSIVDLDDPGGVSPDDRQASEVLTLVEHGFVMGSTSDNSNAVTLARLVSRDFTMRFIDSHNIHRLFYPTQWIAETQRWQDGFVPDRGESFTRFRDTMRSVINDEETSIITIAMRWHDPVVARDIANQYVAAFNEFIRERTMLDVARKQAFLREEIKRSDILDMQQSIYRLIEAQTAIAMLASAREEYALEVIDPAAIPYKSFNMSRKRKVLLGTIGGTIFATFAVLALRLLTSLVRTMIAYRENEAQNTRLQDESTTANPGAH